MPVTDLPPPVLRASPVPAATTGPRAARRQSPRVPLRPPLTVPALDAAGAVTGRAGGSVPSRLWAHRADLALGLLALLAALLVWSAVTR